MAELTLEEVARFIKYRKRAGVLGTDEGSTREAAQARELVQSMIREHPDIREVAKRVSAAMAPEPEPPPAGAPAASRWEAFANAVSGAAADRAVDVVTDAIRSVSRVDEIAPGAVRWSEQSCAPEQVCVLFRMNRSDLRRSRTREIILDGVESILMQLSTKRA